MIISIHDEYFQTIRWQLYVVLITNNQRMQLYWICFVFRWIKCIDNAQKLVRVCSWAVITTNVFYHSGHYIFITYSVLVHLYYGIFICMVDEWCNYDQIIACAHACADVRASMYENVLVKTRQLINVYKSIDKFVLDVNTNHTQRLGGELIYLQWIVTTRL